MYVSIKRKQVCLLQTTLGQRTRTSIRRQEFIYLFLVGITAHTAAQEILKPMPNTIELCSVFLSFIVLFFPLVCSLHCIALSHVALLNYHLLQCPLKLFKYIQVGVSCQRRSPLPSSGPLC